VLIISAHIKKRFVKLLCQTVKKARYAWGYKAITICTKDEQYLEKFSILETIFIDSKGNTIKETMYWKD
jgi:hypothetical protein